MASCHTLVIMLSMACFYSFILATLGIARPISAQGPRVPEGWLCSPTSLVAWQSPHRGQISTLRAIILSIKCFEQDLQISTLTPQIDFKRNKGTARAPRAPRMAVICPKTDEVEDCFLKGKGQKSLAWGYVSSLTWEAGSSSLEREP